jgi:hypothetical protein
MRGCLFFYAQLHIFWQKNKQFPKNNIIFAETAERQMGFSLANNGKPYCFLLCIFYKPKTKKE